MPKPSGAMFSVLTFVTGIAVSGIAEAVYKERVLHWDEATLALVFIGLAAFGKIIINFTRQLDASAKATVDRLSEMNKSIDSGAQQVLAELGNLENRVGIKVRYIEKDKGRANLFRELRGLVEQAKRRIVIINTFQEERGTRGSDSETLAERQLYYDSILEKVAGAGITYRRIIQVDPSSTVTCLTFASKSS